MANDLSKLAAKLKQARTDKGLTLDDMQLLTGLNRQTIVNIELGRNVKISSLLLFADKVGVLITAA